MMIPRSLSNDFEQAESEVVKRSSLSSKYLLTGRVIYRGLASTIFLALERGSFLQVGVKVMMKARLDANEFKMALTEVAIHSSLQHHRNIVRAMDSEHTDDAILLVTPYTPHGDLWSLIQYSQTYCEREVRNCAGQMMASLRHVHDLGIVHGDVKPQNFLLYQVDKRYCVQLCDFGLAERANPVSGMIAFHGVKGTSGWFAPEMLDHREYSAVMDLFACGLIFYRMLGGYAAFDPPSKFNEFVEFDDCCWCHITSPCKDFIQKLLRIEPCARGTSSSALEHEWLSGAPPPEPSKAQLEALAVFGPPPNTDVKFWPAGFTPDGQRCVSYGDLRSLVRENSDDPMS